MKYLNKELRKIDKTVKVNFLKIMFISNYVCQICRAVLYLIYGVYLHHAIHYKSDKFKNAYSSGRCSNFRSQGISSNYLSQSCNKILSCLTVSDR